jgi:hypothetical protein
MSAPRPRRYPSSTPMHPILPSNLPPGSVLSPTQPSEVSERWGATRHTPSWARPPPGRSRAWEDLRTVRRLAPGCCVVGVPEHPGVEVDAYPGTAASDPRLAGGPTPDPRRPAPARRTRRPVSARRPDALLPFARRARGAQATEWRGDASVRAMHRVRARRRRSCLASFDALRPSMGHVGGDGSVEAMGRPSRGAWPRLVAWAPAWPEARRALSDASRCRGVVHRS